MSVVSKLEDAFSTGNWDLVLEAIQDLAGERTQSEAQEDVESKLAAAVEVRTPRFARQERFNRDKPRENRFTEWMKTQRIAEKVDKAEDGGKQS